MKFHRPDPKPGFEKPYRKFAWLPVKCEPYADGPTLWLEHYVKLVWFTERTYGMGEGGGWGYNNLTLEDFGRRVADNTHSSSGTKRDTKALLTLIDGGGLDENVGS